MSLRPISPAAQLRAFINQTGMIVAPGAYDCIGARLAEQAGYDAVYMTGAGTAAALGYPDYGLITMSEMAEKVCDREAAQLGIRAQQHERSERIGFPPQERHAPLRRQRFR